jgi:hypothetical protein
VAGQWQKGKLLGSGTFGCVYEATNRYIIFLSSRIHAYCFILDSECYHVFIYI